jgi:hypothetical protein
LAAKNTLSSGPTQNIFDREITPSGGRQGKVLPVPRGGEGEFTSKEKKKRKTEQHMKEEKTERKNTDTGTPIDKLHVGRTR